jgi:GNAT superfamily N-acetyltransferase
LEGNIIIKKRSGDSLKKKGKSNEDQELEIIVKPLNLNKNNLNEISILINKAWHKDFGDFGYLTYLPEFLAWSLSSPDTDKQLILGAYTKDNQLIGFNAVQPGNILLGSTKMKYGISTYLSIDPDYRRKGVARKILQNTLKVMNKKKYDICFSYFDPTITTLGDKPVYDSIPDIDVTKVYRSKFLSRIVDMDGFVKQVGVVAPIKELLKTEKSLCLKINRECVTDKDFIRKILVLASDYFDKLTNIVSDSKTTTEYSKMENKSKAKNEILKLLNQPHNKNELNKSWTAKDLDWYLKHDITKAILHKTKDGKINGIITYVLVYIKYKTDVKFAWIDNFNLDALNSKEKQNLINSALIQAQNDGTIAIILPRNFQYKQKPFLRNGFIPYPRDLELNVIPLSNNAKKFSFPKGRNYKVEVRY